MKKTILALMLVGCVASSSVKAQGFKNLLNKAKATATGSPSATGAGLSSNEIGSALKEALSIGVQKGAEKLSGVDGFLGNAAVKVLMPPEALKAEQTLRNMGLGTQVDQAIVSMNRAAEDAAKSAAPIFVNTIKSMSITDAVGILKGGDSAATTYLKGKTSTALTEAFRPVVEKSLVKVDATKYWNTVFTNYNKVPFVKKVNPDLTAYVTERALAGMFYQVAQEEQKIRQNPAAQTTALLQKVFGGK